MSAHTLLSGNDYGIKPGDIIGRLTVVKRVEDKPNSRGTLHSYFLCKCECGNEKVIEGRSLHRGRTLSCGCLQRDKLTIRNTHHGVFDTSIYKSYTLMIDRCIDEKFKNFQRYGGRGITICPEWYDYSYDGKYINVDLFRNFYNWAITHPTYIDGYTIDRIDYNGNYEPSNCIWSNPMQQANNRSNNVLVKFNNDFYSIGQLSYILGINYDIIRERLRKNDFNMESIFTEYQFPNGIAYPTILSKHNIPFITNGVYFVDEYGRVYNETDWLNYINRPRYAMYNVNEFGFITGPVI